MSNVLTFAELIAFDPTPLITSKCERYLCPLCGHDKPRDNAHRSLCRFAPDFGFTCWRCGEHGLLGRETESRKSPRPVAPRKPVKPSPTWREVLSKTPLLPVVGTRAGAYLKGRGIDPEFAEKAGVRFGGCYRGRAAILFDVVDQAGNMVAVQGRFLDNSEPRMKSSGPKKEGVFVAGSALTATRLAVVEAPLDAISLLVLFDLPAIATCGSGMPDWLPEFLKGKTVYIATDGDEGGDGYYWGFRLTQPEDNPPKKKWKDAFEGPMSVIGLVTTPTNKVVGARKVREVRLVGEGWADELENSGAIVRRLRPPNAGKKCPWDRTKRIKDWNDELRLRKWVEARRPQAVNANPSTLKRIYSQLNFTCGTMPI